jgi:putative acetyltransferase
MSAETPAERIEIGATGDSDWPALEALYRSAFPDEDLLPLLHDLLLESDILSLAARKDGVLAGHVAFTPCIMAGRAAQAVLLGPLAAAPAMQKRGIGRALVEEGLKLMSARGAQVAYVLGDPSYYGRLGFRPGARAITPCPIPEAWREAWQYRILGSEGADVTGQLVVPLPWRRPELWSA